jgi:hypothetical protein
VIPAVWKVPDAEVLLAKDADQFQVSALAGYGAARMAKDAEAESARGR